MEKEIIGRVSNKYDSSLNWTTNNPVLLEGEFGIEKDTGKFKIGDGTSTWNSLDYASSELQAVFGQDNVIFVAAN